MRSVFNAKPDRPYFESWLRRTRRQLAASGRLSEIALILSRDEGHAPAYWSTFLRELTEGEVTPSVDLLTKIEGLLAKPVKVTEVSDPPPLL